MAFSEFYRLKRSKKRSTAPGRHYFDERLKPGQVWFSWFNKPRRPAYSGPWQKCPHAPSQYFYLYTSEFCPPAPGVVI